ncbi:MAG: SDR family oxidoreductase [Myxococcota bacterium]
MARVVVVTGASAGVGRAVARMLGAHGDAVGLIARGRDGLEEAAREIEAAGGRALVLPLDVADADAVEAAAARVEAELGPIYAWVNNATVSVFSPIAQMTAEEFRRVTEVTYLGYVHGTLTALRRMRPRDRGVIVQVGSALAYRGIPLQSAYCAAKHAAEGFTASLRCELIHDRGGVRVTMVELPAMNTPQFTWSRSRMPRKAQPVPPIFQPEVGAAAVVRAIREAPREVYVAPPTWVAIVGNKLVPGLYDRILARTGYDDQMTGEPAGERPDNLFAPLPGDHGAHGPFDTRALDRPSQAVIRTLAGWVRGLFITLVAELRALIREQEPA